MTGILAPLVGSAPYFSIDLLNTTAHAYSSTSVTSSYTINSAGTVSASSSGSTASNTSYTWLNAGPASGLEVMATLTSGSPTSGTMGSWISLDTNRTWTRTQTPDGTSSFSMTVQIRNASTQEVLDTATVIVKAENE